MSPTDAGQHKRLDRPDSCRSGRQGHKSSEVQVLVPSIARFGRLAYPLLGEVTSRDMRGSKSDGCPVRSTAVGAIWVASKPSPSLIPPYIIIRKNNELRFFRKPLWHYTVDAGVVLR